MKAGARAGMGGASPGSAAKFGRLPYSVVEASIVGCEADKSSLDKEREGEHDDADSTSTLPLGRVAVVQLSHQVRLVHWVGMTSFQLVYVCICTSLGVLVLPIEAERFHSESSGVWVGLYMGVCGITQLSCPVIGKLSDRHISRWGRRRPFIIIGSIISITGFLLMWLASGLLFSRAYVASLFLAQTGINIVYAAQCGLPADFLGESAASNAKGLVSGIIGMYTFLGSLVAMGTVIVTSDSPVQLEYVFYVVLIVVVCPIVCVSARETPTHHLPPRPPLAMSELREAFAIDLRQDVDFFWVCAGRMCYYMSTSVAVFMYFYFRDMMHIQDEAARRLQLGVLAIITQCVGVVSSLPFGRLSAQCGRKPLIYFSCMLMISTFILYVVAPKQAPDRVWPTVILAAVLYGVGSGAYLSVDYAIALDCMPRGKSSAEAFGLWGVIGFLGSTIGPILGGWLLMICQEDGHPNEYNFMGYTLLMFVLGCGMNFLVVFFTSKIEKVR